MNVSKAAVLAAVSLAALAGGAHAQSLREALATAYATSPEIQAERAQLRETDERVPQALANTRPTIQATGSVGSIHETTNYPIAPTTTAGTSLDNGYVPVNLPRSSYGVSINQTLFRGGRTLAEYREAHDLIGAERARLVSVEQRVLLQAATSYAEVLRTGDQADLASARVAILKTQLDQALGRYNGGDFVRTDLLQTQAAYDGALVQLAQARSQLAAARLAFVRDIGRAPETLAFPETEPRLPTTLDEAQSLALDQNPDIRAAELLFEAGRQHIRDVEGQGLPTVGLQAVAERQEGTNFRGERDDTQAVIVQVRVPLYAGGALASSTRAAREDAQVHEFQLDEARRETVAFVGGAWEQLAAARSAVTTYAAQAQINAEALKGTRIQVTGGEGTIQNILTAQQTLYESQSALLSARRDILVAGYTLLSAVGELTAENLHLDTPIYDPARNYRKVRLGLGR